jgi:glycine/D-amino acid oxidase-like deaminating enzyme
MENYSQPVAVVGAGVIGLSCALRLLRAGFKDVTVIADKWTPNTTSDGGKKMVTGSIIYLMTF